MASVLRQIQAEWNSLVPRAQALGIRRVRLLNAPLETIAYRRSKLEWLKAQIGTDEGFDSWSFGPEIECILPGGWSHARLADEVRTSTGLDCRAVTSNIHQTTNYWKVVYDGSLHSARGVEVVAPILRGASGFQQLEKVCGVLTRIGAHVTRACGFHVHVGCRAEDVEFFKRLIRLYARAEDHIDSFMAPSRRRESLTGFTRSLKSRVTWSQLEAATTVRDVARAIGQDMSNARGSGRYCKVNLQNFGVTGTVEFRQHQGTVEASKAINWIKLVLRMCAAAKVRDKQIEVIQDLEQLRHLVEADDSQKRFFTDRVAEFKQRE